MSETSKRNSRSREWTIRQNAERPIMKIEINKTNM